MRPCNDATHTTTCGENEGSGGCSGSIVSYGLAGSVSLRNKRLVHVEDQPFRIWLCDTLRCCTACASIRSNKCRACHRLLHSNQPRRNHVRKHEGVLPNPGDEATTYRCGDARTTSSGRWTASTTSDRGPPPAPSPLLLGPTFLARNTAWGGHQAWGKHACEVVTEPCAGGGIAGRSLGATVCDSVRKFPRRSGARHPTLQESHQAQHYVQVGLVANQFSRRRQSSGGPTSPLAPGFPAP